MARSRDDDTYSEEETQRRVEATLRAAFEMPRPKKPPAKADRLKKKPDK
jgi:hypothetical protein